MFGAGFAQQLTTRHQLKEVDPECAALDARGGAFFVGQVCPSYLSGMKKLLLLYSTQK